MKKAFLLLLIFKIVFIYKATAQQCEWLTATKGGVITADGSITTDYSDNIIVAGNFGTGSGNNFYLGSTFLSTTKTSEGLLIKYNGAGGLLWAIQTSSQGTCIFVDVVADKKDNIYVLAQCRGNVDFGNGVKIKASNIQGSAILIKYNSSGSALRAINIADNNTGNVYWNKLTIDAQANLFIAMMFQNTITFTGWFTQSSAGLNDVVVAKFDSSGRYIVSTSFGGLDNEMLTGLETDAIGNVYLLGVSNGGFTFASNYLADSGEFLLKLSPTLQPIKGIKNKGSYWSTNGGTSYEGSLAVTENGHCVITGRFIGTANFNGVNLTATNQYPSSYLVYYDTSLAALWGRKDVSQSTSPQINSVTIRNHHIYFGGSYSSGNGFIKYGPFQLPNSSIPKNLFLVKTDTLGNFLWAFGSPTGNTVVPNGIRGLTTDVNGNCIVMGESNKTPITVFNLIDSSGINGFSIFTAKITDFSISRGNVYRGPYCAGDSIKIPYTKIGKYEPGNEFIAQLSDSSGNFDGLNGIELGRKNDTAAGIVSGVLPSFNVATNNRYRIRILTTKPAVQSFYRLDTLRLLIFSKDTANAGSDTTICFGQSIRLGTTGGSKWLWEPPKYMHIPSDTGNRQPLIKPDSTFEYRVIISDSSGCGVTDTDFVKINVKLPLVAFAPDTVVYCKGRIAAIACTTKGGDTSNYTFEWSTIKDSIVTVFATDKQVFVNPDSVTQYRIVVNDNCSVPDTAFVVVMPDSGLQLQPIADTIICLGNSLIFNAKTYTCDTLAVKYVWDNGLGEGAQKTVSPALTTTYNLLAYDTINGSKDSIAIKVTVWPALQLAINADTTICNGNPITLKAYPTGGQPTHHKIRWTEANDAWADTNFTTIVYPKATNTYTAVLTDDCSVKSDTQKVEVVVREPLQVSVNNDTTICVGENVLLFAVAKGGDLSQYKITWNNGSVWTDTNFITTIKPSITTTYTAILTDNCTAGADTNTVKITVRPPLSLILSGDSSICYQQTTSLKAIPLGGFTPQHKIIWKDDNSTWTDTNYTISLFPLSTTVYTVTLSDNCTLTPITQTIKVQVKQPLTIKINGPDTVCTAQPFLLTAGLAGGDSLQYKLTWVAGTTIIDTTNTRLFDTLLQGTTYTATLADGCSPPVNTNHTVTVIPKPKAAFNLSDTIGCAPLRVSFTDKSTDNDSQQNTWNVPQLGVIKAPIPHKQLFTTTGMYRFSLLVSNNGYCKDSSTKYQKITVYPLPKASFIIKPDIKESGKELLLLNTSQGAKIFEWITGDGNHVYQNNLQDTTHRYNDSGDYTIRLLARNEMGCVDTFSRPIRVFSPLFCTIPNAFTPNGDGINNTFAPVCSGAANYTLTIFTRWGQIIQNCTNCSWDGTYANGAIADGAYLYLIKIKAHSGLEETLYGMVNVLR